MTKERRRRTTVVIVQSLVPGYRRRFYELLRERLGASLVVVAGEHDFADNVVHDAQGEWQPARNRFLARRRVLWQSGTVGTAVRADVAVLVLNPRILSTWVSLLLRRFARRRTVLWGHAWPRRGRASGTDLVRHVMRRLADTLIVYTEQQAVQLRDRMPSADIVAAPNALYYAAEIAPAPAPVTPRDFVCVGRLVAAKKPALLLDAFRLVVHALPRDVRVVFVGDGPLRARLDAVAREAALEERVLFHGHEDDLEELRRIYAGAIASVSPGYVGLSLIQTLGFGVTMLVARDEPHAPEIEAAVDGQTVTFFDSDSAESLARLLVDTAQRRTELVQRRDAISAATRRAYSIESMVSAFVSALRLDDPH